MSGARSVYTYSSDDGNDYAVSLDSSNALAAGFVAAGAGINPNKPRSMHMRYVLARAPGTGRERRIYIPTASNAMYVGGTTTITIESFATTPSALVAHAITGRVGEKRYAR